MAAHIVFRRLVVGAGLLLLVRAAPAQKPSFEVASVKPNLSVNDGGTLGPRGDEFVAVNVTLRSLILYAYSPPGGLLLNAQVIGGPDWMNTDHFDVQGKVGGNARELPKDRLKAMLQSLLEDRFQVKLHPDTRDLPVYNLVLFKSGPKPSEDQTPPDPRQSFIAFASSAENLGALPRGAIRMVTGPSSTTLTGTAISISRVISLLQGKSGRIILDKTGFTSLLDVRIEFSQDLGPDAPLAPSLFAAIEEIGLKLTPAKSPLDVLVIESVHKPSAN